MSCIPYGYRYKQGKYIVDELAAEKIRSLFQAYLRCNSMKEAAKISSFEGNYSKVRKVLGNEIYVGNEKFPQIVEQEVYDRTKKLRTSIGEKYHKFRARKIEKKYFPVAFKVECISNQFEDPYQQAQYIYTLIKEVNL